MTSGFAQVGAQLAGVAQQQSDLQRAVAAGELWMEAGVAENAAVRCDQAAKEINQWLDSADRLAQLRKFGDNEDGQAAAKRFAGAGWEITTVMKKSRTVFENMAATYRAAGRTVTEADVAGEQTFQGKTE